MTVKYCSLGCSSIGKETRSVLGPTGVSYKAQHQIHYKIPGYRRVSAHDDRALTHSCREWKLHIWVICLLVQSFLQVLLDPLNLRVQANLFAIVLKTSPVKDYGITG